MVAPRPNQPRRLDSTRWITSLLGIVLLVACGADPDPDPDPAVVYTGFERTEILRMSPMPPPPADPSNAHADDPNAAKLGHRLFFETRLSGNGEVACATCHDPEKYFADGLARSKGIEEVGRNSPTALGAAHADWLF